MQVNFDKIIGLISAEKFEHCRLKGEENEIVFGRYKWNTALSEAFYPSLQALEVGFRNRIHGCIATVCNSEDWLLTAKFLYPDETDVIEAAKEVLQRRGKQVTTGYLIAELKFGFWTALADSRYDTMWPKIIRPVFPFMPASVRTRREISRRLNRVRNLRNSISHHHSIWHWQDLEDHHRNIHILLEWMEPEYANAIAAHDRFPAVLGQGHSQFI